ncbi:unnamed protein product [Mycena citricolor]|uniref:Uncharacterized protein n=1 Tax=Mycena citricolor TaxID=2018698 RepID=A0AAD2K8P5_9AGAR|nr:unnamed protein product [Mycena citricolor]
MCPTRAPSLPPELELRIFELAADLDPGTIPVLLRVAQRVHSWIEPKLYSSLSIDLVKPVLDTDQKYQLLRQYPARAEFFHRAIRHVAIQTLDMRFFAQRGVHRWSAEELATLLHICSGATNVLVCGGMRDPDILSTMQSAGFRVEKMLLLVPLSEPGLEFSSPVFGALTHLCLFDLDDSAGRSLSAHLPELRRLPALTHLAIDARTPLATIDALLRQDLRVLLLWDLESKLDDAVPGLGDRRVVVCAGHFEWIADWHSGASGAPDFWVLLDRWQRHGTQASSGSSELYEACHFWRPATVTSDL